MLRVLEVARRRDDDGVGGVAGVVVGADLGDRNRGDDVGAPEHPAAERVVAEDRLGEHVVDAVRRLVLVHRDLLEDHLALGLDLVRRQGRRRRASRAMSSKASSVCSSRKRA